MLGLYGAFSIHHLKPKIPACSGFLRSALADRTSEEFLIPYDFVQDRKSTRLNSSHLGISYAVFFLTNDTATTEISPLPLHDALPISPACSGFLRSALADRTSEGFLIPYDFVQGDRKSTRLNSSHLGISYAVF